MSWFFSVIGFLKETEREKLNYILPQHSQQFEEAGRYYLVSSASSETCFTVKFQNDFRIALGIGIQNTDSNYAFLASDNWNSWFEKQNDDLKELNGHFILCSKNGNKIVIQNDALGVREFFFCYKKGKLVISSRAEWIARFTMNYEINFKEFSTRWIFDNQISSGSIFQNITRAGASSKLEIDFDKDIAFRYNFTEKEWLPDISSDLNDTEEVLKKLITFPLLNGKKLNFALSGGFDSRFILAFLLQENKEMWESFTFGDKNHPDARIASEISRRLNFRHIIYDDKIECNNLEIEEFKDFAGFAQATSPISEYLTKRYYPQFSSKGLVTIDGGFGEILRRGLFNKLYLRGKKALLNKTPVQLNLLLRKHRADIFIIDIKDEIERNALVCIQELLEKMPSVKDFGIENWLDLLSVRTKLTNYCSIEQARLDNYCISYNPFSQKDFLNLVFKMNVGERLDSRFMKRIIENKTPLLKVFPLVKGNVKIPYTLSTFNQKALAKIKNKIGIAYPNSPDILFLDTFKQWVTDRVDSSVVRNNNYYDYNKIKSLVNSYYSGNHKAAVAICWFLSFDVFLSKIRGNG